MENEKKKVAVEYFERAYEAQMQGAFHEAIRLYNRSLEILPTAEAYTFLGWTFSFMGDYDRAIESCQKAIQTDPDFGNPYNDIGAYLIETGKPEEAIPYLERALHAPRYESYCFPHYNLGRVYELQGQLFRAREEYNKALEKNPRYLLAKLALDKLSSTIQ